MGQKPPTPHPVPPVNNQQPAETITANHSSRLKFILLIVLILLIAGVLWYLIAQNDNGLEAPIAIESSKSTSDIMKSGETPYSNDKYHFSFTYPSNWVSEEPTTAFTKKADLVFSVGFHDPNDDVLNQQSLCFHDQQTNWQEIMGGINQTVCEPLLENLSPERVAELQKDYDADLRPGDIINNIFVRVYSTGMVTTISDWLTSYHKDKPGEGELVDYQPGKKIKLGGLDGLASQIGCCTGYDFSYAVLRSGYVYELGTNVRDYRQGQTYNEQDNTLVQQIADSFSFNE